MKITTLIRLVNQNYPDDRIEAYWDSKDNMPRSAPADAGGDLLAKFIVYELYETFASKACSRSQLNDAANALERAIDELENIRRALLTEAEKKRSVVIPFKKPEK